MYVDLEETKTEKRWTDAHKEVRQRWLRLEQRRLDKQREREKKMWTSLDFVFVLVIGFCGGVVVGGLIAMARIA